MLIVFSSRRERAATGGSGVEGKVQVKSFNPSRESWSRDYPLPLCSPQADAPGLSWALWLWSPEGDHRGRPGWRGGGPGKYKSVKDRWRPQNSGSEHLKGGHAEEGPASLFVSRGEMKSRSKTLGET